MALLVCFIPKPRQRCSRVIPIFKKNIYITCIYALRTPLTSFCGVDLSFYGSNLPTNSNTGVIWVLRVYVYITINHFQQQWPFGPTPFMTTKFIPWTIRHFSLEFMGMSPNLRPKTPAAPKALHPHHAAAPRATTPSSQRGAVGLHARPCSEPKGCVPNCASGLLYHTTRYL